MKTRILLNAIYDHLYHSKVLKHITSGSGGEGLEMKGSDLDIMIVFKGVYVYEDISSARVNSTDTCVAMEMKDTKLGFSHLRLLHCNSNDILKMCTKVGNDLYLSNQLCKSNFMHRFVEVVHGRVCQTKMVALILH